MEGREAHRLALAFVCRSPSPHRQVLGAVLRDAGSQYGRKWAAGGRWFGLRPLGSTLSTDLCVMWVVGSLATPPCFLHDESLLNSFDKSFLKRIPIKSAATNGGGVVGKRDEESMIRRLGRDRRDPSICI